MAAMNRRTLLQTLPAALALSGNLAFPEASSPDAVYELRQYTASPGKLDELLARFRNHTVAIFNRHNMRSLAYWTVIDPAPDTPGLVYILVHPSREEADKNWAAFRADPEWIKVKADSEVHGSLTVRTQSTWMKLTDFSPLK
jgi:hypothetical protein